jgi:sugar lactone lactonase YvrE
LIELFEEFRMRVQRLLLIGAGSVLLLACAEDAPPPATMPAMPAESAPAAAPMATPMMLPALITIERGGVIPEGIEYDQTQSRLLVGSLSEGTVFRVNADGTLTPVVEDAELRSSIGIEVDEPRNRLLVANSDAAVFQGAVAGQAKLGVYNLSNGARLAMVDLAAAVPDAPADAKHFANDVTVDDAGNVYVTDSMTGTIYRVDSNYSASVFYQFPPRDQFMINGLVYDPSGFLLVVDMTGGNLYKIPVADPAATTQVALPEPVTGADGAVWQDAAYERLAIVSNSDNRVVVLTSADDWTSAQIAAIASFDGQATTAASVNGEIYIVRPHFEDPEPPTVERVTPR